MDISLVRCTRKHLKELIQISRRTFVEAFSHMNDPVDFQIYINTAFSEEALSNELKDPNASFYFVLLGDELAGYFKINRAGAQTDINEQGSLEIERIYVAKEHQGKNIGQWMMETIKELALHQGTTYLWLGVWEKNPNAIRFYQKHGFKKFGEHPYYIGKDKQTDWLMRCDIPTLRS